MVWERCQGQGLKLETNNPKDILAGKVARPAEATHLYRVLKDKFGEGGDFVKEEEEDRGNRDSMASSSTARNSGYQRSSSQSLDNRYSMPVEPPYYTSASNLSKRATIGSVVSLAEKKRPPPIPPKRRQTVSANYDYVAQRDSDLSFRKVCQSGGFIFSGR
jgi:hypothetical protein